MRGSIKNSFGGGVLAGGMLEILDKVVREVSNFNEHNGTFSVNLVEYQDKQKVPFLIGESMVIGTFFVNLVEYQEEQLVPLEFKNRSASSLKGRKTLVEVGRFAVEILQLVAQLTNLTD